jgi:hypothetical protein
VLFNRSWCLDQSPCRGLCREGLKQTDKHPVCDDSDRLHTHERRPLCGFSGGETAVPQAEKIDSVLCVVVLIYLEIHICSRVFVLYTEVRLHLQSIFQPCHVTEGVSDF